MTEQAPKSATVKARLPRGLADRGPAEIAATNKMMAAIRETYELYGFEAVETPFIEYTEALGKFIGLIDADLKVRNDDYLAHRSDNSVRAPRALAAAPGTFAAWMKTRGRVGGQNRVPRVINDAELFANLAAFAAKSSPQ